MDAAPLPPLPARASPGRGGGSEAHEWPREAPAALPKGGAKGSGGGCCVVLWPCSQGKASWAVGPKPKRSLSLLKRR